MGTTEIHVALRVHALGGLSISANGEALSGTVARRRSLALLALVASAGESGVSDEHALSLLWADFDTARARNNLKQVAFTLRQALGRDAFLRTTTNLRLDPALFKIGKHTSELQSPCNIVCRLLLEKKNRRRSPARSRAQHA